MPVLLRTTEDTLTPPSAVGLITSGCTPAVGEKGGSGKVCVWSQVAGRFRTTLFLIPGFPKGVKGEGKFLPVEDK